MTCALVEKARQNTIMAVSVLHLTAIIVFIVLGKDPQRVYFTSAMTSTSINAPLGSCFTATAERAG
jgi:hypothetical protein